ncbi:IQ calmodulin-binding motif-containing, partial [Brachionus plicatilis]
MEKLFDIAQQITDARKHEIPQQLVKLRQLINQNYDQNFKHEIYKLNLLDALSTSFKYDYGYIRDGWELALELVKIFRDCVHNFFLTDKEYQNDLLPNSLENVLILSKKIQEKYNKGKSFKNLNFKELEELFRLFKSIHNEYCKIVSNHSYLAQKSFNSQRLFQLLLNDDQKTTTVVIQTYNSILNTKNSILRTLPESVLNSFLDEIIYKLASNEQSETGNAIFQLLVTMCKIDTYLIKLIARRY